MFKGRVARALECVGARGSHKAAALRVRPPLGAGKWCGSLRAWERDKAAPLALASSHECGLRGGISRKYLRES